MQEKIEDIIQLFDSQLRLMDANNPLVLSHLQRHFERKLSKICNSNTNINAEEYFETMKAQVEHEVGEEAPNSTEWKRIFLQHYGEKQYSTSDQKIQNFYRESAKLESKLTVKDHGAEDSIKMRSIGRWMRLNLPSVEDDSEE
uniref:Uncharacterized protein n=2 Tax=Percolomonas cosmopolitus TaxID=63605 RepID=A0A7S1KPR5_9EUKA|mmetsp:Transcript_3336/g.12679  ORF Transcript_3336/g.12679 Transcript_3336/m.12679 type:complete len:143 (+) Transcript_3336:283-711(+)